MQTIILSLFFDSIHWGFNELVYYLLLIYYTSSLFCLMDILGGILVILVVIYRVDIKLVHYLVLWLNSVLLFLFIRSSCHTFGPPFFIYSILRIQSTVQVRYTDKMKIAFVNYTHRNDYTS